MKPILLYLALFLFNAAAFAQKATVFFDYEKNNFNENQPLPAETYFVVTGNVNTAIHAVAVKVFGEKDEAHTASRYTSFWKRPAGQQGQTFYVPVNYKLRGDSEYDFAIEYYRLLSSQEKQQLALQIQTLIEAYLDQSFSQSGRRLKLLKRPQQTLDEMNAMIYRALTAYHSLAERHFSGFSDLILNKVKQMEGVKERKGEEGKRAQVMQELAKLANAEVATAINSDLLMLADRKILDNYAVEHVKNILTFQVGYGAVGFRNGNRWNYDGAPQIGLVFPLGNRAFASTFWSRSSIVAGVFLKNLQNDQTEVSGPLVKRPVYVGIGYQAFRFIRINLGAVALENAQTAGGTSNLSNRVFFRPYVGVTADFKLWLDLAR